ncbi:MAG: PIN domain-containing protein [Thermodesulfovibrionales bacterium]
MKGRVLADTSVWIEFFKSDSEIGDQLEALLKGNSVWTCGITIFELLQGVKSDSEKKTILEILSALPYVEMSLKIWHKAAEISVSLKKKGLTLPLSDILIASIAIENNLSIFTLDKHFALVPGVRLLHFS